MASDNFICSPFSREQPRVFPRPLPHPGGGLLSEGAIGQIVYLGLKASQVTNARVGDDAGKGTKRIGGPGRDSPKVRIQLMIQRELLSIITRMSDTRHGLSRLDYATRMLKRSRAVPLSFFPASPACAGVFYARQMCQSQMHRSIAVST